MMFVYHFALKRYKVTPPKQENRNGKAYDQGDYNSSTCTSYTLQKFSEENNQVTIYLPPFAKFTLRKHAHAIYYNI